MTNVRCMALIMLLFGVSSAYCQNQLGMGQTPFGAGISPEKNEQMQKEMEQFEKEFASLSPEEQNAFMQTMDDAVKKIDELSQTPEGKELLDKLEKGTISDEELDGLINQLVEEETSQKEPDSKEDAKKEKEPKAPKQVLTTEHEKAIDAINSLIAHTNSFIIKAATVPEMPSKIKRWARGKHIRIKPDQTWSSFKNDLEGLVELLNRLLERDTKTKEYYHIDELLKKESLLNNIKKIQKNVAALEPQVEEVPLLEAHKMKKETSKAYQRLINEYVEALNVLKLSDELKDLFKLFDPKAKKYREQQEQAVKEAEQQAKQTQTPARSSYGYGAPTGMPSRQYAASQPRIPEYAYQPAEPPAGMPPRRFAAQNGQHRPLRAPTKQPRSKKPTDKQAERTGVKDETEAKDQTGDKEPLIHPAGQSKRAKDIDVALSKIEDKLTEARELIEDNDLIKKLDKELINSSELDASIAVEIMPNLNKALNIKRGLLGDIQQLHRKVSEQSRSRVKKRLRTAYDKEREPLDQLKKKIETLEKNWETHRSSIPAEKQYSYFGMTDIEVSIPEDEALTSEQKAELKQKKDKLDQAKMKVIAPYSFFEIADLLEQIKQAVESFDKSQLAKPKEKK